VPVLPGQALRTLLDSARDGGVWTVQAGIFPENEASVALDQAAGFRVVGAPSGWGA
jgi:phosphinothricin acetyltransferase